MIRLADTMKCSEFGTFALVAWEYLLRVQSEAIPLLAGEPDNATSLANQLHSGVWVDKQDTLCLRLQCRKNRPQGSLLRRQCVCATRGRQLCVVPRTSALLAVRGRSQPLWNFSSEKALQTLRRFLILTDTPQAASYTLKAFRAGKATALAAEGKSLGQILQAGEWRSSAFLSYVDTDVVDQAQLLDQTLALSDEE